MRTVAVVGASLAGLSAARSLRELGFDGRVTIVGAEPHQPYDRPPLSKEFLLGTCTREALALGGTVSLPEMYRAAGAKLVFNEKDMGELVTLVESELISLRNGA